MEAGVSRKKLDSYRVHMFPVPTQCAFIRLLLGCVKQPHLRDSAKAHRRFVLCPFQGKMVTLKVQEYDSGPFSDMSPTESGNVCHDPGGRCEDDALAEGTLALYGSLI